MNSKKLFTALSALLVVLGVCLLGSVYLANTALGTKSDTLVDLKATKLAKQDQEKQLAQAKKDVQTYNQLNEIAKSVVPQDKDQAKTVSEITDLAAQSGIGRLSSISFPPSTLGALTAPSSTSGTTCTGSTPVKTPGGLTQVTPVKGMPGVYQLPITVTQADTNPVSYGSFITFLSKLEHNRRTAQISSISVQPSAKSPDRVSFTLVIKEYIKP